MAFKICKEEPKITISYWDSTGSIRAYINKPGKELFEKVKRIDLYFDEKTKKVGIKINESGMFAVNYSPSGRPRFTLNRFYSLSNIPLPPIGKPKKYELEKGDGMIVFGPLETTAPDSEAPDG